MVCALDHQLVPFKKALYIQGVLLVYFVIVVAENLNDQRSFLLCCKFLNPPDTEIGDKVRSMQKIA